MMWFMVALGGAFGALARFGLSSLLAPQPGKFPYATFTANVMGCLVMGFLYLYIVEKTSVSPYLRPLLMVGFLGAFTTFSSFSIEALTLWQSHQASTAVLYVMCTVISCLLATLVGLTLCEKFVH